METKIDLPIKFVLHKKMVDAMVDELTALTKEVNQTVDFDVDCTCVTFTQEIDDVVVIHCVMVPTVTLKENGRS